MKRHTYSLLMALIRLGKGALSACESWVIQEWKGDAPQKPSPVESETSEG